MVIDIILTVCALLIVTAIHEFFHAFTAYLLGDPTAKYQGRLTLNPLKHVDPVGLLMMFMVHIGWGKPVPVNPNYFKHPKRDEAITAIAGPASNLVLAVFLAIPLKYLHGYLPGPIEYFLSLLLDVSLILFAFNILPFPPLDGSKFVQIIIPRRFHAAYDKYLEHGAIYFMLFLLFDQFIFARSFGFSILSQFIGTVFTYIKTILFLGT